MPRPSRPVTAAVRRDIRLLAERDPSVRLRAEAALALALAQRIDDPETPVTGAASAASRLLEAMAALRALAAGTSRGPLDEIRARRAARTGAAAAADSEGPRR
jgi:hypothetical protein